MLFFQFPISSNKTVYNRRVRIDNKHTSILVLVVDIHLLSPLFVRLTVSTVLIIDLYGISKNIGHTFNAILFNKIRHIVYVQAHTIKVSSDIVLNIVSTLDIYHCCFHRKFTIICTFHCLPCRIVHFFFKHTFVYVSSRFKESNVMFFHIFLRKITNRRSDNILVCFYPNSRLCIIQR